MTSCKPCPTSVDIKGKLSAKSSDPYNDSTKYRRLAGALQYFTFTRPDISYVVQKVCLFMHAPKVEHMESLKRIIRYVQGTINYGMHLYKSSIQSSCHIQMQIWVDVLILDGPPRVIVCLLVIISFLRFLSDNLQYPSLVSKLNIGVSLTLSRSESCWIRNLLLELHCPIQKATLV
ncbi:hypothetical protein LguiA_031556 [Lonicera macranthoides]